MRICNEPILDSPWSYDGTARTYHKSGTPPGLPTFGAPGTNFPDATEVIVVASGNNTTDAADGVYQVNNAVVYFEPGQHVIQGVMFAGNHSAYVGGYTSASGKAIINGVNGATTTGDGGIHLVAEKPSVNSTVDNTWEYLTIENYVSSGGTGVMGITNGGSGISDGDTFKYDTIGPNEYNYVSATKPPALSTTSAPGQGGGYAIMTGSYTTIEYDCITQDAEGAFGGLYDLDTVIANNEISRNGLGSYPDNAGAGASPFACGCSGGGKEFFSVNNDVVNNYIHDNYNVGVWFDFDNTGMLISHNYIASNWGAGIDVEASYNADISDNTLVGNGWASDGLWPAGVGGKSCYNGVSCTSGFGPITGDGGGNPYSALYLPNSGGDPALSTISIPSTVLVPGCSSSCTITSRYSGEMLVTGNMLINNFGGVSLYTDTIRYPGNIDEDSSCSNALGPFDQANSATYYTQTKVLQTTTDTAISGTSVTSTGDTLTLCSNYGAPGKGGYPQSTPKTPSAGMEVFDETTGRLVGTVASASSAHAFTLTAKPPGGSYNTGNVLLLSATGGCGPADYYGGGPRVASGSPSAYYWDHCLWASKNVTISRNVFSIDASTVSGCTTTANLCGYQQAVAFNGGVPLLMQYWYPYTRYIASATAGVGNVYEDNDYTWTGGGKGAWLFNAGRGTLSTVDWATWRTRYGQDAGSKFER